MSGNRVKITSENLRERMYLLTVFQRIPPISGDENRTKTRFSIIICSSKNLKFDFLRRGLLPFYLVKQIGVVKVRS